MEEEEETRGRRRKPTVLQERPELVGHNRLIVPAAAAGETGLEQWWIRGEESKGCEKEKEGAGKE